LSLVYLQIHLLQLLALVQQLPHLRIKNVQLFSLKIANLESSNSLSTGAIGGIAVCGVLGAGAAVFGMFLFIRRRRRISRSRGNIHIGEEDIKMLPQKHLSLRYPNTDGRDYSANLGTDERDPPPSPFQPKFAPALISISRA